jgi:hypothetical protein
VSSCTKSQITLETSGTEIGTALLADSEHLLDHAAEHQAQVHDAVTLGAWHSPAWTVVTAYYWAFFSVLALGRLTGRSAWFLDRSAVTELRTLAGAAQQPGAGAMYLTVGPHLTATTRTIVLRPSKAQLHDAVWTAAHRLISDVFAHSDQNADPTEYRLWWAFKRTGDFLGADWASKLRNVVNYRPGCGYREVIRRGQIDMARHIRQRTPATASHLVGALEDEVIALTSGANPGENVKAFSRLLGLYAAVIAAAVGALHAEVLERHGGDQRWRSLRSEFFAQRCGTATNTVWPLSE